MTRRRRTRSWWRFKLFVAVGVVTAVAWSTEAIGDIEAAGVGVVVTLVLIPAFTKIMAAVVVAFVVGAGAQLYFNVGDPGGGPALNTSSLPGATATAEPVAGDVAGASAVAGGEG